MQQRFQQIASVWVALLLILLPFAVDLNGRDPAMPTQLLVLAVALLPLTVFNWIGNRVANLYSAVFGLVGLLVLGWGFVTAAGAANPTEAHIDMARTALFLVAAIQLGAASRGNLHWLMRGMALSILVQAVLAQLQFAAIMDWPHTNTPPPYGCFPNKNVLSIALTLMLPGAAWLVWKDKGIWRIVGAVAALGALVAIAEAATRSAMVGLALGLAGALPLAIKPLQKIVVFKRPVIWAALLFAGLVVVAGGLYKRYGLDITRGGDIEAGAKNSIMERAMQWHHSFEMVKESPVMGVGPGQWKTRLNLYGVDNFVVEVREGSMMYQRPHNDFVWVLAETGIPGLLLFLGLLAVPLLAASVSWRQTQRPVTLLTIAGILTFAGISMFSFPKERIMPLLLAGCWAGLAISAVEKDKSSGKLRAVVLLLGSAVMAAFVLPTAWKVVQVNKLEQQINSARQAQQFERAASLSRECEKLGFTLDRTAVPFAYYQAEALLSKGAAVQSLPFLEASRQYNPSHILTRANLANVAFMQNKFEEALATYNQVLALSPRYEEVLMNKAAALYRLERFEEAMATLKLVKQSITTDRYDELNQATQAALRAKRKGGSS